MTQEELDTLCLEWQKRLRLQDWDVKVKIARFRELDTTDRAAQVSWVLNARTADIAILDPIDYPVDSKWIQDVEESLVHELLHLHFVALSESWEATDYRETVLEQALTSLDMALVNAKRGNGHSVEIAMNELEPLAEGI